MADPQSATAGRPNETVGLIETMRLDADGPRHLDRHLARLRRSARGLGLPVPGEALEAEVGAQRPGATQDPAANAHAGTLEMLRLELQPDGSWTMSRRRVPHDPATVVHLAIDTEQIDSDDPLLRHKTTRRSIYDLACARRPEADDVILVGSHGRVTETSIASLLVQLDGQWWTPPLADGLLPGIGREIALDRGEVAERLLTVGDVQHAEALAVLSSARGRRPAVLATR